MEDILNKTEKGLEAREGVIKVVDTILPNNPVINILKIVEKYAQIGVGYAEQLYIGSELQANERDDKAKDIVYSVLKILNIEVTPDMQKIIDGAIEAEVLTLGHKPTDVKQLQDTKT